jgi:hypothetical protein
MNAATPPPPSPPPAAPSNAPKPAQSARAPDLATLINAVRIFIFGDVKTAPPDKPAPPAPAPAPRWYVIATLLLRLVWPLAVLGTGITLFVTIGANAWLWLVIALVIACGIFARPPKPPIPGR